MASHPQLLSTIPILLGILANGPVSQADKQVGEMGQSKVQSAEGVNTGSNPDKMVKSAGMGRSSKEEGDDSSEANKASASEESTSLCKLDEAMAADCYQVLTAVCALPRGPDQLVSRGAIPALCQAVKQDQTFSQEKGLALLGCLLSGKTKDKVWSKHPAELSSLLVRLSRDFCQATDQTRLDMCAQLAQFLPPVGVSVESEELRGVMGRVWGVLRPMLQAKMTPRQIGPILVLSACLLDLYGWELVGPPKFCCLLVNRACVEVRMGLEEPPGNEPIAEVQHTLTGSVLGLGLIRHFLDASRIRIQPSPLFSRLLPHHGGGHRAGMLFWSVADQHTSSELDLFPQSAAEQAGPQGAGGDLLCSNVPPAAGESTVFSNNQVLIEDTNTLWEEN